MRILVTAVFEQLVYHCTCVDDRDPAHPRLEVDAILRDGDADGPLLLPVADYIDPSHLNYCSRLTRSLKAGTYYVGVAGLFNGLQYQLQARAGP